MDRKRGFTLLEVLTVAVIIGILTAIVSINYFQFKKRPVIAEALMGLGNIRTAQRAYYSEHGFYEDIKWIGDGTAPYGITPREGGINGNYGTGDIDGTYFSEECYQVRSTAPDMVMVICVKDPAAFGTSKGPNIAPRKDLVEQLFLTGGSSDRGYIAMREDGRIVSKNWPDSGY